MDTMPTKYKYSPHFPILYSSPGNFNKQPTNNTRVYFLLGLLLLLFLNKGVFLSLAIK